jgi:hypothetical protein
MLMYTHVYALANVPGFAQLIRIAGFSTVRACQIGAIAYILNT